jgi:hypothetical protein
MSLPFLELPAFREFLPLMGASEPRQAAVASMGQF